MRRSPHVHKTRNASLAEPLEARLLLTVLALAPKVDYPTGSGASSLTSADFNGDGNADIAIVRAGSVSVFLGNADGTFLPQVDYPITGEPIWLTSADFNGDGKPDIAVANEGIQLADIVDDSVSLFMNNGNGTFAPQVDYPTPGGANFVAAADFNGDGSPDIAALGENVVSVFINNQNGTFAPRVDYASEQNPVSLQAGDFNGDGKLDMAVANLGDFSVPGEDTVSIFMNHGDGTFAPKVDYLSGVNASAVVIADFNGDGTLDLALTNQGAASDHTSTVSVLLNHGDGSFLPRTDYPAGDSSRDIITGDFNLDGKPDLAVANNGSLLSIDEGTMSVFLNLGDGTFAPRVDFFSGSSSDTLVPADFNGDGAPDIAVLNAGSSTLSIFLNAHDGGAHFVDAIYTDLLGRQADPSGQASWLNYLHAGHSYGDMATAIATSREYDAGIVDGYYMEFLGRHAETAGLTIWVNIMQTGSAAAQIRAGILGSQEYYTLHGGTDDDFLNALYTSLLNRDPESPALPIWLGQLDHSTPTAEVDSRIAVTDAISQTPEANSTDRRQAVVTELYQEFLHRNPDDTGLTIWVSNLNTDLPNPQIISDFVTTPEYLALHHTG